MNAPLPAPALGGVHASSGQHLLADLGGIAPERLRDAAAIDTLLRAAAEAAGARVLHSHFHSFGPGLGVTGVVLLAESHISIHTWPETGFAAVDIFMCGQAEPQRALALICASLAPQRQRAQLVGRSSAGL
ncbi:adenosylmethionine decarboxylase [Massilia sp. TS11]|uniref:adenosylmethionine decarboxylase n=1 Tax=Massilia sp. TS11 TaxID=2908003 RepID=UPI001EDC09E2|nr:adenosylmethionine decarboxylase [Massilia sp. TS11]MCG2585693.1 adenosylmethionine decarboxylase [Massilia sp. TS11]